MPFMCACMDIGMPFGTEGSGMLVGICGEVARGEMPFCKSALDILRVFANWQCSSDSKWGNSMRTAILQDVDRNIIIDKLLVLFSEQ